MVKCKPERDTRTKAQLLEQLKKQGYAVVEVETTAREARNALHEGRTALVSARSKAQVFEYERDCARLALDSLIEFALLNRSPYAFWVRVRRNAVALGYQARRSEEELISAFERIAPKLARKALKLVKDAEEERAAPSNTAAK